MLSRKMFLLIKLSKGFIRIYFDPVGGKWSEDLISLDRNCGFSQD
jgi:hypothetical protein